jgi:hypothetical protein
MNTQNTLERAVDLLCEFQLFYQNSKYLSTSEQKLNESLEELLNEFRDM